MKFKHKKILMTLGLTAVLFAFPALAHASSIPFNVSPIYPDNQIQNEGFYYLKMTPGQEETVNVTLSNTSSKPVTIDIETATAKTDSAGFVGYMPLTNIPKDSSLKYDLTQYMKAAPKVTIPAGTSKNVPVTIEMPNASFDGIIAGGLTFKQEDQQSKPAANQKGISVINNYQYVVAVVLRQNMNIIPPQLSLTNVEANQVNLHNVINIGIRNSAMAFANQMDMNINIQGTSDKTKNVHFVKDQQQMQMAPNTNFEYPYQLNGQAFVPGKYHATINVWADQEDGGTYSNTVNNKTTNYKYHWTFDEDFTITAQKAAQLNSKDVTIPKAKAQSNWGLYLIIGLLILIIAGLLIWIILGKRRKKENEEQKAEETK